MPVRGEHVDAHGGRRAKLGKPASKMTHTYQIHVQYSAFSEITYSPRARGVLFVLKGPYDLRVPPIVKISQESESARPPKIILSKSTVKTL